MKSFQFIRLVGFDKHQQEDIIKGLGGSNPIILIDTEIHLEESQSKNIQLITLTNKKP